MSIDYLYVEQRQLNQYINPLSLTPISQQLPLLYSRELHNNLKSTKYYKTAS